MFAPELTIEWLPLTLIEEQNTHALKMTLGTSGEMLYVYFRKQINIVIKHYGI